MYEQNVPSALLFLITNALSICLVPLLTYFPGKLIKIYVIQNCSVYKTWRVFKFLKKMTNIRFHIDAMKQTQAKLRNFCVTEPPDDFPYESYLLPLRF